MSSDISFSIGEKVRMSALCKSELNANDSHEHIIEFGHCIGVVEGPVKGPGDLIWPDIFDVRWQPSNLRYCYPANHLEKVLDTSIGDG